jgi:hypothetical protein
VILALSGTVFGAACQGFLEATLEPFLADQVTHTSSKQISNVLSVGIFAYWEIVNVYLGIGQFSLITEVLGLLFPQ